MRRQILRRVLAVVMLAAMLVLLAIPALADTPPGDSDTARVQANSEIQSVYTGPAFVPFSNGYFLGQNINGSLFNHSHQWEAGIPLHGVTSHALIYGDPSAPDSTGFSRYLGETTNGEQFTNIQHPYDVLDVSSLDQLYWIPQPWSNNNAPLIAAKAAGDYGNVVQSPFDGMAGFGQQGVDYHTTHEEIMAGLMDSDPQYMSDPAANNTPWQNMVHIWDPPTRWAWGAGIMYDTGSTIPASDLANAPTVYYKTVLLPPLDPSYWPTGTLSVIPPSQTINVGDSASYTALYTPYGGQPVDVTSQSTWSSSDNSIAAPASTPGVFNGMAPGTITVTATYLTYTQSENHGTTDNSPSQYRDTATLTVQAQQPPGGGNNPPNPPNNPINPQPGPSGNGALSFQAVSQAGTNIMGVYSGSAPRPAGTAKWGDTVTATLTVPEPTPPQGTITSWSVDSASLVYPQKASDYTYDDPAPPTGTKTISMTVSGPGATATFCEDWAEDGADLYSIVQGEMIVTTPEPYTITASYSGTMNYEYTITDPDGTATTVNASAPFSGTVSGSLEVDGTGVTPAGE